MTTTARVNLTSRNLSRRSFLVGASAAGLAGLALPAIQPRYAFAEPNDPSVGDTLVFIFLSGGADGLNMVVPHFDETYYSLRPTISIPKPGQPNGCLDLDGQFGLHPAMTGLYNTAWRNGHLAMVHSAGFPDNVNRNRSHFEAKQYTERGTPDLAIGTGWISRHLTSARIGERLPAIATDSGLPETLRGPSPAVSLTGFDQFRVRGFAEAKATTVQATLQGMYPYGDDDFMVEQAAQTLRAVDVVAAANPGQFTKHRALYEDTNGRVRGFAGDLYEIAQLLRANVGLRAAVARTGGWDDHFDQGTVTEGKFLRRCAYIDKYLTAFYTDLMDGGLINEVTVVLMSEFGRTGSENGSVGTDHGRGGVVWLLGGGINGGVYGRETWPALVRSSQPVVYDYRDVLAEVVDKRLGNPNIRAVFPDLNQAPYLGVAKPS